MRKKKYCEDKAINDVIWEQIHKYGAISRTYLMRKCKLSDAEARKLIENLPGWDESKIKEYNRQKAFREAFGLE